MTHVVVVLSFPTLYPFIHFRHGEKGESRFGGLFLFRSWEMDGKKEGKKVEPFWVGGLVI